MSEDRTGLDAELARTEPASSPSGPDTDVAALAPDTAVGRYLIVQRLGSGAMGVVYEAWDPSLDRSVALKLMASGRATGSGGRARLLREAQALARLSHPNVIAVHDVGAFGDQVFIAMELVRGSRLAEVMRERAGRWKQLLPLFLQAGEGLAAAHAAGLVHRDFKPENVLVGEDGRVRVLDFGLARAAEAGDAEAGNDGPVPSPELGHSPRNPLATPLTELGAVVGTPAYMAPEQFRRSPTDARTDQWAFCVALYAALFGQHPFGGERYEELAERVLGGRVRPAPPASAIPGRLRRIVLRGLAGDPAERYPSIAALLADLRAFERGRRVRGYALGGLLAAGACAGGIVLLARSSAGGADAPAVQPVACPSVESRLTGIWDDDRRAAARRAFLATGKPYAGPSFAAAAQMLDAYASSWVAANQEACMATRVHGTQSEELLDLRSQCLDERLHALRALTDLLVAPDDKTVLRAVPAAGGLLDLEGCADAAGLRSRQRRPASPEARQQLAVLQAGLDRAQALADSGRYPEGLAVAEPLAADAVRLGFRPAEARALWVLGNLQLASGSYDEARRSLESSSLAAEAGRDDEMMVRALNSLVYMLGDMLARPDEAFVVGRRVEAALERMGGHERERGILLSYLGMAHWTAGRYPESQAMQEQALVVLERALGKDHLKIASALLNLGNALELQGKNREAEPVFRRALEIRVRLLGQRHPAVADVENSLGNSFDARGDVTTATQHFERALAVWEEALGAGHPHVAVGLDNLGRIRRAQGRYQESLAMQKRALDIRTSVFGADHPETARSACSVGFSLIALDQLDDAGRIFAQCLAATEKTLGPDHPQAAGALEGLGHVLATRGRRAPALAHLERALRLREKAVGPEHPDLTQALAGIGRVHLFGRAHARAREPLERALRLTPPESHTARAEIEFLLGRVLFEGGIDRARGGALVQSAGHDYARAGFVDQLQVREVRAWLARHGGGAGDGSHDR